MELLTEYLNSFFTERLYHCVISGTRKKSEAYVRIELQRADGKFMVSKFTKQQVFHTHLSTQEAISYIKELLSTAYRNLNAWDDLYEYSIAVSQKGKVLFKKNKISVNAPKAVTGHNRVKKSLLPENTFIEPLYDMGIYTKQGTIVTGMYDKFRQINRFLEIIEDALKKYNQKTLNILDFGCGKSYLTFVLYYYLTHVLHYDVNMIGLDLKRAVIDKCNAAAQKYGYDTLRFETADIGTYHYNGPLDLVVSLHACDTATDFALFNAIKWNAKMIFAVPCCQHELNNQIHTEQFSLLSRYGILKDRFCAIATDAIRANMLEFCGYRTQILEFIDMEHTPKNIMIRAIRTNNRNTQSLTEIESLMNEFSFCPTLYTLLKDSHKLDS